jgi:hypothetical protein
MASSLFPEIVWKKCRVARLIPQETFLNNDFLDYRERAGLRTSYQTMEIVTGDLFRNWREKAWVDGRRHEGCLVVGAERFNELFQRFTRESGVIVCLFRCRSAGA